MCGIFGYIGIQNAIPIVMNGLKKLEYRGYDSAGIAVINNNEIQFCKEIGKVSQLHAAVSLKDWKSPLAIAHTRWATHGTSCLIENAHPHFDKDLRLAVVHNGIIENYEAIRNLLKKRGISFRSETDSEVISQLVGYLYKGDFLKAVQRSLNLLKGSFALALIHKDHPDQIICAAKESPLAIGLGQGEVFIASDSQAFLAHTRRAIYLQESEVAVVKMHSIEAYDQRDLPIVKEFEDLKIDMEEVSKGTYQHYMLKEIFEQTQSIRNALLSRYSEEYGTAILEGLEFSDEELLKIQHILILGCGTSWHAGLLGAYMIEEQARIPVQVEIASEFRYKNPILRDNTLVIAISQSGETADTIAAMRELKERGAKILGICNVQGSSLAREVGSCLFLRAGPEIGVASTKAFTSQLVVLALLSLRLARMRTMSKQAGKNFIQALIHLPEQVKEVLKLEPDIRELAKKYAYFQNFFFLGRRFMYPTALEGALKLKEIAYIDADGYPAGEMKHGPIALINENCPTVAFCADSVTYSKMLSNLREIKARGGPIIAIAEEGSAEIEQIADHVIRIPKTDDALASILSSIISQLLAYNIAFERDREIDQPRNLAKSVTVE